MSPRMKRNFPFWLLVSTFCWPVAWAICPVFGPDVALLQWSKDGNAALLYGNLFNGKEFVVVDGVSGEINESLAQFAKKLGLSASHLCDIEKGRKVVSPERAARFAKVLGRSREQFVRLSLQEQVDLAGLKMRVNVDAA